MRVFVTGGTRVLGQPVVRLLVEQGHDLRGLAHSQRSDETLRSLGAEPVNADLFDADSLRSAMDAVDAVLHLATRIPPPDKMRIRDSWNENDRIRREGTRNLIAAARERQVTVFVYPSVTLVYPDSGSNWIDASNAQPQAIGILISTIDAETEVSRFGDHDRRGISLRLGTLYGPSSPQSQEILTSARHGIADLPGRGDAYQSSIWVEDAAHAIVSAMEGAPSNVYDVVDDEPLTNHQLVEALARAVGRTRLRTPPGSQTSEIIGSDLASISNRSQRVSNRRFREATGWKPSVPSAREGWQRIAVERPSTNQGVP